MADRRIKVTASSLLLALLPANLAFADGVVGTYYEPYEDTGNGYYPETLKSFSENGRYEINVVDHGFLTTFESTYSVKADQVTITQPRFVHKCSWSQKIVGKSAILSFKRTKDSLMLTLEGDNEILLVATPEQIKKVMAVPVCTGQ